MDSKWLLWSFDLRNLHAGNNGYLVKIIFLFLNHSTRFSIQNFCLLSLGHFLFKDNFWVFVFVRGRGSFPKESLPVYDLWWLFWRWRFCWKRSTAKRQPRRCLSDRKWRLCRNLQLFRRPLASLVALVSLAIPSPIFAAFRRFLELRLYKENRKRKLWKIGNLNKIRFHCFSAFS